MDHAPERDSSQRPTEEGDVERRATSGQVLDGAKPKGDISDVEHGLLVQRLLDAGSIRVERKHLCGDSRVLEREATIAAADLEDAPALQCREALDQPDLHPVRRIGGDVEGRRHRSDASVDRAREKPDQPDGPSKRAFSLRVGSSRRSLARARPAAAAPDGASAPRPRALAPPAATRFRSGLWPLTGGAFLAQM